MRTGGSPAGIASVRARRTAAQAAASARLAACFSPASSVIGKIASSPSPMNFNISPPWVSIAVVVRRERRSIGGNLEAIGRFAINAGQRAPCETGHIPDFYVHGTPTSFSAPLTEAPPAAQQRRDNRREAPTSSRFVQTDPSAGPSPISLLERRWPNAHGIAINSALTACPLQLHTGSCPDLDADCGRGTQRARQGCRAGQRAWHCGT